MLEGSGKEYLNDALAELANYTQTHFEDEEELMEEAGYPELDQHREQHEAFKANLAQLVLDFREGEPLVQVKLMRQLKHWLDEHITHETRGPDYRLGRFLRGEWEANGKEQSPQEDTDSPE